MSNIIKKAILTKYTLACCVVCLSLPVLGAGYNSNLISNGDAEVITANDPSGAKVPGWSADNNVTIEAYDAAGGYPTATDAGSSTRGRYFFNGGSAGTASAKQTIDLSFADSNDLDAGKVSFKLSAWLGGYLDQEDFATVVGVFYDAQGNALNTVTLGPVSASDRINKTGFLERSASASVPAKARSAVVTLNFTRQAGTANDGYIDDVSLIVSNANASACKADATLVKFDYLGACGLTNNSNFTLDNASDVSRIRIWYNTNIGGAALTVNITGPNSYSWSGQTVKGGCDPYQKNWCEGIVTLNTTLAAGNYALAINSTSMCANPSGQTTLLVYGCVVSETSPGTLPVTQWINGFDISIDENFVDTLLPSPTFSEEYYRLRRSYNPFGNYPSLDFKAATLKAGIGAVRVEHLILNGVEHWVDLSIDVNRNGLPMVITGIAPGSPPTAMPHWNGNFPGVDFNLANVDIFGPPTRITWFDIGIDGHLFDVDFMLNPATEFVLSTLKDKGYVHYLPTRTTPAIAVGSKSATPPNYSGNSALNLPGVAFQSPLALFGWTGGDGEQELLVEYASGSQLQHMTARDGVLVGTYSPPPFSNVAKLLTGSEGGKLPKALPAWLRSPTLEESLNSCIDEKTKVQAGFKADNELSQQLVDLVFTVAGHDSLKLSNGTLEKIRTAIADSKDSVLELMANGKVDSATLGVFVSSTVLKNATPEEHQRIIDQVWDNKIPDHAKTAAGTSGSAAETNYKLAGQALADGLASTFFPAYTGAVKTVIQSAKYANDTLADQAFQELYKAYKASNGNWDDVITLSPLSTNKFAEQKVRNILEEQGKASDDSAISAYLKNKMQTLYTQEQQAGTERDKLLRAKDQFLALDSDAKESLKRMLGGTGSNCDLLQKYLDFVANAQLDLVNSMGDCKSIRPSKSAIEQQAYFLARARLGTESVTDRKNSYQKSKLSWLKVWECLRYEDARKAACSDVAKAGADTPETVKVELGQTSGSFAFDYETYGVQDRMIVAYENAVLFDSGCVGTNGFKTVTLPYTGKSSQILVRVEPNCAGTSGTQWQFKASCPAVK